MKMISSKDIVHIDVDIDRKEGKWLGEWTPKNPDAVAQLYNEPPSTHHITANRREELERKLEKALRLAFPKANYIVQHRESLTEAQDPLTGYTNA